MHKTVKSIRSVQFEEQASMEIHGTEDFKIMYDWEDKKLIAVQSVSQHMSWVASLKTKCNRLYFPEIKAVELTR